MAKKEELETLLLELTSRRGGLLDQYLSDLAARPWNEQQSMNAVNSAGRLHDIDRHITNVQLEIKRLEGQPHAS